MQRFSLAGYAVALAALLWASAPALAQEVTVTLDDLRRGGYVLLFHHAHVEVTPEQPSLALDDCAAQRHLTERGHKQAMAIGEAFRALKIPVGSVLASGYCRTMETAQLAFGRAEASVSLLHADYVPVPGAPNVPGPEERMEQLKQLLSTPPPPGLNTVLVTHGSTAARLIGGEPGFGNAVLYRPDGRGGHERIVFAGRFGEEAAASLATRRIVSTVDWTELATAEAARPNGLGPAPLLVAGVACLLLGLVVVVVVAARRRIRTPPRRVSGPG